jgi:hypothetical protein
MLIKNDHVQKTQPLTKPKGKEEKRALVKIDQFQKDKTHDLRNGNPRAWNDQWQSNSPLGV